MVRLRFYRAGRRFVKADILFDTFVIFLYAPPFFVDCSDIVIGET